jgi:hypothetical protein
MWWKKLIQQQRDVLTFHRSTAQAQTLSGALRPEISATESGSWPNCDKRRRLTRCKIFDGGVSLDLRDRQARPGPRQFDRSVVVNCAQLLRPGVRVSIFHYVRTSTR